MRLLLVPRAPAARRRRAARRSPTTAPGGGKGIDVVTAFYPLEFVAERVAGDHADVVNLTQPGNGAARPRAVHRPRPPRSPTPTWSSTRRGSRRRSTRPSTRPTAYRPSTPARWPGSSRSRTTVTTTPSTTPRASEEHVRPGRPRPALLAGPAQAGEGRRRGRRRAGEGRPGRTRTTTGANAAALRRGPRPRSTRSTPTGCTGCARDTVVVSHNAFGYLGRYGLFIEPISGLSPEAEPTPADLARLQQLIDDGRASPPSSASGWSAPSWRRASPTTWASRPRSSTRSRG